MMRSVRDEIKSEMISAYAISTSSAHHCSSEITPIFARSTDTPFPPLLISFVKVSSGTKALGAISADLGPDLGDATHRSSDPKRRSFGFLFGGFPPEFAGEPRCDVSTAASRAAWRDCGVIAA